MEIIGKLMEIAQGRFTFAHVWAAFAQGRFTLAQGRSTFAHVWAAFAQGRFTFAQG